MLKKIFLLLIVALPQLSKAQKVVNVGKGWAHNSVNVVVFRKNSLFTHNGYQYIAYYDSAKQVVLGKRKSGATQWQLKETGYKGNAEDAHNSISIIIDGSGFLHLAWDHHNNKLNYVRSINAGSLELTEKMTMTGLNENRISYPEFYKLKDGNLVFLYRDGGSGGGNLVVNRYDLQQKKWEQLHSNLIDGQGKRNAYWQACIDNKGALHISWVWRESPDVASNHDMCYAKSIDGGLSWMNSSGTAYSVPINAQSAEYAAVIPQKSELINQTSMTTDPSGNPVIASYWRQQNDSIPQYHIIYKQEGKWKIQNLGFRKTAFSLSGVGTKRIPLSRPQIIAWKDGSRNCAALIFRDEELGSKISAAVSKDLANKKWEIKTLLNDNVGSWEPSYDTGLWTDKQQLNLFVQKADQVDGEGKSKMPAQMVKVLEWKPLRK